MASRGHNGGANQHGKNPILHDHPELPNIIQGYINTNVLQKDLPELLQSKHGVSILLRSVQNIMKASGTKTVRKSGLTPLKKGLAILTAGLDVPLERWGCRLVQEKLAKNGVHVTCDFIMKFWHIQNSESAAACHPATRRKHNSTIWSLGPNEEWCLDGHKKIFLVMGIAIWGVIDKFSHKELGLWAVPNARLTDVPPILYLRLVRELGGMPLTSTADKGTKLAKLIPLITTLRQMYQPYIDEEVLPAHCSVKSVYNVTCEHAWRPLWEKELGNVRQDVVSLWLWRAIVQACLENYKTENGNHHVRYQPKSLLPTDGRRVDFYESPGRWGGSNCLIKILGKDVDMLLEEYDKPDLLQFGTADMVSLCKDLYRKVGSPSLKASEGWNIFKQMITAFLAKPHMI